MKIPPNREIIHDLVSSCFCGSIIIGRGWSNILDHKFNLTSPLSELLLTDCFFKIFVTQSGYKLGLFQLLYTFSGYFKNMFPFGSK